MIRPEPEKEADNSLMLKLYDARIGIGRVASVLLGCTAVSFC
jgi:hypothetical protein